MGKSMEKHACLLFNSITLESAASLFGKQVENWKVKKNQTLCFSKISDFVYSCLLRLRIQMPLLFQLISLL